MTHRIDLIEGLCISWDCGRHKVESREVYELVSEPSEATLNCLFYSLCRWIVSHALNDRVPRCLRHRNSLLTSCVRADTVAS